MKTTIYPPSFAAHPWLETIKDCPDATLLPSGAVEIDFASECLREIETSRMLSPITMNRGTAGARLKAIIRSLVPNADQCFGCWAMAEQMNVYGDDWCVAHREQIVARLRQKMVKLKPHEELAAVMRAIAKGMAFIEPGDVPGSIFDEAVRRSGCRITR